MNTLLNALRHAEVQGFRAIVVAHPMFQSDRHEPMGLSDYIVECCDDRVRMWTLVQDRIWCTHYRTDLTTHWKSELWFELRRSCEESDCSC